MKIFLDTIGCRVNQAEIEKMAGQFQQAGHTLVASASEADLVVINTCAVTGKAVADSRQAIRRAVRDGANVVATGCWATLEPEEILKLEGVSHLEANSTKHRLVENVLRVSDKKRLPDFEKRIALPGCHFRTRAFIKVQDGCDNFCTFCVTRIARGKSCSETVENVVKEIQKALNSGVKEAVLSGVNLGSWGRDFFPARSLGDLLGEILSKTDIPRLRLSSLEPWDFSDNFFSLWQDHRLCPHLHLPLQSGSASILKAMGRKVTPASYANIVARAREVIPDFAITTDVMVGFPGEGEEEFLESVEFIQKVGFSGGHVFQFSPRPGTPAACMNGRPALEESKRRSHVLRQLFADLGNQYRLGFQDKEIDVLWESATRDKNEWRLSGLSSNYIQVQSHSNENRWNHIDTVRVEHLTDSGVTGKIASGSNAVDDEC